MTVKKVKLAQITPDNQNANNGTKRGQAQLEVSLRKFGYADAGTLDKNNRIINGNKRTEVTADVLGVDDAIIIEVDGKLPVFIKRNDIDLNTKQGRELAYALNRIHEVSYALNPLQMANDLETYGADLVTDYWTDDELISIINDYKIDDEDNEGGEGDDNAEELVDKAEELNKKWLCETGQLWEIPNKNGNGSHFVIIGDCTIEDDVKRLLNGKKANVVFTSPPYAMQRKDSYGGVETDKYVAWWQGVQSNVKQILAADGSFFVNIKAHCEDGQRVLYCMDLVLAMVRQWGWRFVDELCWLRNGIPGSPDKMKRFKNQFEQIYWFSLIEDVKFYPKSVMHETDYAILDDKWQPSLNKVQGSGNGIVSDRKIGKGLAYPGNVIKINNGDTDAIGHSAAFPVALPTFFIKAYSDIGDIILDPFCGSGTTIVAAENEGRLGYGVERLPKYGAVILERLSKAGLKPKLVL